MNTTFLINGGAGRVITAIPALEKFARRNPDNDFRVLIHGWDMLLWSHPLLQKRTYPVGQKGIFENYIRNNQLICPEPYYIHGYYSQQLSMAEAFDQEINETTDHSDLEIPRLYISQYEKTNVKRIVNEWKKMYNRSKIVVFQPFGSGATVTSDTMTDKSQRSFEQDQYFKLAENLSKDCLIVFFGQKEFRHSSDKVTFFPEKFNPDLRMFMSLISECDYFIGCDSVGQHIARAFNRPGTVFMGSTFEKNVSYPDHFRIARKAGRTPYYDPIRINHIDSEFAHRENDGIMNFSDEEIVQLAEIINRDIYDE